MKLPKHLQDIRLILADRAVKDSPMAKNAAGLLPGVPIEIVEPGAGPPASPERGHVLYLKHYMGRFLKFCPGTRHYRCCGYRIIHIGENCPVGCSYCILQAYFQDRVLKAWANTQDMFDELEREFAADPKARYRAGTGEFTDSLVLEPLTGISRELVRFLAGYENVCLELKSKVVDLSWMDAVKRADRVLPAWSMNAPEITAAEEGLAAGLEERLAAARQCADLGFRVCLHFDPIIHYPGWEQGYARAVDMIFDYLRPQDIAYMSLGSFRFMPGLKKVIEDNHPAASYIYGEFITGLDNKMRLLRPLRVEQFRFIVSRLRARGMGKQLYFCMESDEVWRAVFGYAPKDLGGLSKHLLSLAFGE